MDIDKLHVANDLKKSAKEFCKLHSKDEFQNYYKSNFLEDTLQYFDISLDECRLIRRLFDIDDLPKRKKPVYKNKCKKICITNGKCQKMIPITDSIPDGYWHGILPKSEITGQKISASKKGKPAHNKNKKAYHNGETIIYLSVSEEIPDGFEPGGSPIVGKRIYHTNDGTLKYFSDDEVIPEGWIKGDTRDYEIKMHSITARQDNIEQYELDNNVTLKSRLVEQYKNGWQYNPELREQLNFIKYKGYNFISNDQIPLIANYHGNRWTNAIIRRNKFATENNCTLTEDLIKQYGQLLIFNDLPKIHSNGRTFISNDLIPQIEDYVNTSRKKFSNEEKQVVEYLKDIYAGPIIENTYNIIKNKVTGRGIELDLYLPELKLAIEYNGIYWHSSLCDTPKDYHINKSKACEELGIRLIHIYGDEWIYNQDKIKQLLSIAVNHVTNRIYARNCDIKIISNKEAKSFSDKTHLQGHRNASVTYGLFYNNELVQLMSFSKTRNAKSNGAEWEIIRGCPGSNNIVVGGVSKLFKHFIDDYNPKSIFSYCDFNKFNGKSYENLGMKFIGYTGPDKYWVIDGRLVPRNPNKYRELKDKSQGILWGSGSKKYLWVNNNEDQ